MPEKLAIVLRLPSHFVCHVELSSSSHLADMQVDDFVVGRPRCLKYLLCLLNTELIFLEVRIRHMLLCLPRVPIQGMAKQFVSSPDPGNQKSIPPVQRSPASAGHAELRASTGQESRLNGLFGCDLTKALAVLSASHSRLPNLCPAYVDGPRARAYGNKGSVRT